MDGKQIFDNLLDGDNTQGSQSLIDKDEAKALVDLIDDGNLNAAENGQADKNKEQLFGKNNQEDITKAKKLLIDHINKDNNKALLLTALEAQLAKATTTNESNKEQLTDEDQKNFLKIIRWLKGGADGIVDENDKVPEIEQNISDILTQTRKELADLRAEVGQVNNGAIKEVSIEQGLEFPVTINSSMDVTALTNLDRIIQGVDGGFGTILNKVPTVSTDTSLLSNLTPSKNADVNTGLIQFFSQKFGDKYSGFKNMDANSVTVAKLYDPKEQRYELVFLKEENNGGTTSIQALQKGFTTWGSLSSGDVGTRERSLETGCPPGYKYLAQTSGSEVTYNNKPLDVIQSFDKKNTYAVLPDISGKVKGYAKITKGTLDNNNLYVFDRETKTIKELNQKIEDIVGNVNNTSNNPTAKQEFIQNKQNADNAYKNTTDIIKSGNFASIFDKIAALIDAYTPYLTYILLQYKKFQHALSPNKNPKLTDEEQQQEVLARAEMEKIGPILVNKDYKDFYQKTLGNIQDKTEQMVYKLGFLEMTEDERKKVVSGGLIESNKQALREKSGVGSWLEYSADPTSEVPDPGKLVVTKEGVVTYDGQQLNAQGEITIDNKTYTYTVTKGEGRKLRVVMKEKNGTPESTEQQQENKSFTKDVSGLFESGKVVSCTFTPENGKTDGSGTLKIGERTLTVPQGGKINIRTPEGVKEITITTTQGSEKIDATKLSQQPETKDILINKDKYNLEGKDLFREYSVGNSNPKTTLFKEAVKLLGATTSSPNENEKAVIKATLKSGLTDVLKAIKNDDGLKNSIKLTNVPPTGTSIETIINSLISDVTTFNIYEVNYDATNKITIKVGSETYKIPDDFLSGQTNFLKYPEKTST